MTTKNTNPMITANRRGNKRVVLAALEMRDLQTIAEISASTGLSKVSVRNALVLLMADCAVYRRPEVRQFATYESHIYAVGAGEPQDEPEMPIINERDRKKALKHVASTICLVRSGYVPGMFDPFRVLRAQVGAA